MNIKKIKILTTKNKKFQEDKWKMWWKIKKKKESKFGKEWIKILLKYIQKKMHQNSTNKQNKNSEKSKQIEITNNKFREKNDWKLRKEI